MNVSYKREMRHNYLILEAAQEEEESFELRMLTGNSIEGLLKLRVKQEETGNYYYYEITSKQPLSRLLEFREMQKEELIALITEIGAVLKRIEDYLLTESNLWLEPEHIYIEPESYQVWLCYIPGYKKSFPEAMEKLLQYLLKKTDHKDNETVVLAYRLYQESQKDYYGIEDLLRIVRESQMGKVQAGENGQKWNRRMLAEEEGVLEESSEAEGEERWDGQEVERGKKREEEEERKKKKTGNLSIKGLAAMVICLIAVPGLVWLYGGVSGLYQYKIGVLIIELGVVLGGIYYIRKNKPGEPTREKEKKTDGHEAWQMHFQEEYLGELKLEKARGEWDEVRIEGNALRAEGEKGNKKSEKAEKQEGEDGYKKRGEEREKDKEGAEDTVLLAESPMGDGDIHLLKSVNPSLEDIVIPYFPFIIGKQEGIVDYVLKKDTISRIHLRIDEEDGKYRVTDLNSSNGTSVGDYRLEANESYPLDCNDKLTIADLSYVFY